LIRLKLPENFYKPSIIVSFSTICSVCLFFIVECFFPSENFYKALALAIGMPIAISFPISLVSSKHHKKIYDQKLELEKLNKLNNKLFSIIAHDIRGPLSIIKGYVEILQDVQEKNLAKEDQKYLINLSRRVDHLLLFLNDLLQWSKNQITESPINPVIFNSKTVIDESIQIYDEIKINKNITINANLLDIDILSDKEAYAFIVRNIIYNALKFTTTDGVIGVHTFHTHKEFHTIIKDNGVGISDKNLKKIMTSKEWFSTNGTNKETGTGFGIKTCIHFLNLQDGKLEIESTPNKGSKITVILPYKLTI
jgi:signal transduction histidine kinase